MAGLWDQIGGFISNVGDIAQNVASVGEQWASTISTFQTIGQGGPQGVPPHLGNTLPFYSPIYPQPGSTSSTLGSIATPIESSGDATWLWVGAGLVVLLVAGGAIKLGT